MMQEHRVPGPVGVAALVLGYVALVLILPLAAPVALVAWLCRWRAAALVLGWWLQLLSCGGAAPLFRCLRRRLAAPRRGQRDAGAGGLPAGGFDGGRDGGAADPQHHRDAGRRQAGPYLYWQAAPAACLDCLCCPIMRGGCSEARCGGAALACGCGAPGVLAIATAVCA